ncbi:hypothetical protein NTE_00206 [Candidatus Nitrososphaera evergladensis SR1]|uniref:Uncharacterized protein n=1 Tax=Candidatus Nitrososphaera evergladensis SR1 TaxID=1459636 RepID=A0A075MM18_9ARCH|nr:hypothetical protein NTE_00206 [Candidatus Nitrososphaera evergladensis SR1]
MMLLGREPRLYFIPTCSKISDDPVLGSITKLIEFFYIMITDTKMQKKRRPYLVLSPASPQHCTMSRDRTIGLRKYSHPKVCLLLQHLWMDDEVSKENDDRQWR